MGVSGKQVSEQPRYRAGLIPHRSSCPWAWPLLPDLVPTGFSKWDLDYISPAWNSSLYSILAGSPWFYPFALCLYVGGRHACEKVVSKKTCGPLDSRESMQVLGSALPGVRIPKTPWLRMSERPWDHKPLRRQSLCPWRGTAPAQFTLPCLTLSLTS